MKQKLREKYLPSFHKGQMMDNWLNLKQLNTNVSDYCPQFEEMKYRCSMREEQWVTMTKFINGLRDHLKREVSLRHLESSVKAIQKALEIDKYKKASHSHRWTSQAGESMPFKVVAFQENSYSKGQAQFNQFAVNNT